MTDPLLSVAVAREHDVVLARQRARQVAGALGFDITEQTRIATAVSEIARNAYAYAGGLAAFGGVITVCFFGVWRRLYGPAALGRIQGAAQFLTVLASGLSQALYPVVKTRSGEYTPLFVAGAVAALALAVWSYFVRVSPPPAEGAAR